MSEEDLTGAFGEAYFRENYADYDLQNPPHKMAFYRALAERTVAGRERPRVLELGCAFGRFLGALGPRWERFGTDVSEFALARARAALPDVRFALAGATEPAFTQDGPFDLVAAFDVLEHVPDLSATAAAVRAALAPGGHFLFVVPVYDGPTGPLVRILDADPTHIHKRARAFWLDWARESFQLDDWQGIYRYLLPTGRYLHWPTTRLRRFAPAIAVIAGHHAGSASPCRYETRARRPRSVKLLRRGCGFSTTLLTTGVPVPALRRFFQSGRHGRADPM